MIRWSARSLRGRFLLLAGGIYLLVGAIAAVSLWGVTEGIIRQLGADYAAQYAERQKAAILAKVDREVVLARKLAGSPVLRKWCRDESNRALTSLAIEELDSFRILFADRSCFFVVDASRHYYFNNAADEFRGRELRYTVSRDDPTSAWYAATMEKVDDYALNVNTDVQLGVTKVWINAVVKDGEKKVGLGGSGLDLTDFIKEIVQSRVRGVETILVDAQGVVQGYSDVERMQANARIPDVTRRLKADDLLDSAADRSLLRDRLARLSSGASTVETFEIGAGGENVIAAATRMRGINWAALVLVRPSEVFRFRRFVPIMALLAVAFLLTLVLVSWALDRLVLGRLARLTVSTGEMAEGHYDIALAVDRPDETGHLTGSFNHMAATIRDYTQDLEAKVRERTEGLSRANELLDATNRKLMDSIAYARLIQGSLLAGRACLDALLPEWVVYWRPRDVVGGDFYALYPQGDGGFLLAVADCTGHGVPGAFMTMAAKAFLDRAVAEHGNDDPAALLRHLDGNMRALLSGEGQGRQNGMDLALVVVGPGRSNLRFAAARLPLWVQAPDGSFSVVAGGRHSLGYAGSPGDFAFTNHIVRVEPGQRFFLLTDGLLDQPHGHRSFGLGQRRLQEALSAWVDEPMRELEARLDTLAAEHLGPVSQRDDITLVGFRLDVPADGKEQG